MNKLPTIDLTMAAKAASSDEDEPAADVLISTELLRVKVELKTVQDESGKPRVVNEVTFVGVFDDQDLALLCGSCTEGRIEVEFRRPGL